MIERWNNFIYWLLSKIEDRTFGARRSGLWPHVRAEYLKTHKECAVCGTTKEIEVHHISPVHREPSLELVPSNLISLCRNHHYLFGHLNSWYSFNADVRVDALYFNQKITSRP